MSENLLTGLSDYLGSAARSSVASVSTKVSEGASSMLNTFGGTGPFEKIGANAQSFVAYANTAVQQGSTSVANLFASKDAYSVGATAGSAGIKTADSGITATGAKQVMDTSPAPSRDHLFSLTSKQTGDMVEFVVMPEVVENRDIDYEAVAPLQFPGSFQKYKGTSSVVWQLNATLISRTTAEATQNLQILNRLRGWTMPYFGENTAKEFPTKIGAPPDVLTFKGLRDGMIGPVPVVIKSLNWNWPKDVDYIPAYSLTTDNGDGSNATIPFPTVIQIAINMVESFSTEEFNNFSLSDYHLGRPIGSGRKASGSSGSTGSGASSGASSSNGTAMSLDDLRKSEAQTIVPSAASAGAGRGFVNPALVNPNAVVTGNAGRGSVNPPFVVPAISERTTATISSGNGGNFGGGGASGGF